MSEHKLRTEAQAVLAAAGQCEQAAKALDQCRAQAGYEAGYFCRSYVDEHKEAVDTYAEALTVFVKAAVL